MINSIHDLAYFNEDGSEVLPTGPCSAWPMSRNKVGPGIMKDNTRGSGATTVKASMAQMAGSLFKTGVSALKEGRLEGDKRDARYAICLSCPLFIPDSKRCSECGCFMEAKTWIKGASCPVGKW